jgi:hypothetical protein
MICCDWLKTTRTMPYYKVVAYLELTTLHSSPTYSIKYSV